MDVTSTPEIITIFVIALLFLVIFIFLSKAIINWTHEVGYRNRLMEAQIVLLGKLLKSKGESQESINQIIEEVKKVDNKKYGILEKYLMDNN